MLCYIMTIHALCQYVVACYVVVGQVHADITCYSIVYHIMLQRRNRLGYNKLYDVSVV